MIDQAEKTPAEIKAEKFASDPDKFICVDDIVVGIIKGDKGMAVALGSFSRVDYEVAQSRLNYRINQVYSYLDADFAAKNKPLIDTGKAPMDFARTLRK